MADGRHLRAVEVELDDRRFVSLRTDISELVRAREVADATSRSKSAFVANTSHEIRTPLNAILGLSYLMQRQPLPMAARTSMAQIATAGTALLSLLNSVLDLSKVEAGMLTLEQRAFSLRTLLEVEMPLLAAGSPRQDLQLQIHVAPELPRMVFGDAGRLRQVLTNLLGNALKFTERGTVKMKVRHGAQAPLTAFEVADTGIGIDTRHQAPGTLV